MSGPRILLLDGDYPHSLAVARELREDLGADIVGSGSRANAPLLRSRYLGRGIISPAPSGELFARWLGEAMHEVKPDIVLPLGYHSSKATYDVLDGDPGVVPTIAHRSDRFELAADKERTYAASAEVGVRAPRDLTARVLSGDIVEKDLPIFAKARHERGGMSTAFVASFKDIDSVLRAEWGRDALFQEYIRSTPSTFAYQGWFREGEPIIELGHEEMRSVPRRGGSGTRVRLCDDADLFAAGRSILRHLKWTGIAQVEFKRDPAGELVLMEINPKFWASYSLASWAGYRIATASVAEAISINVSTRRPRRSRGTMVFPVREMAHVMRHRDEERILPAILQMLRPPAVIDTRFRDLPALIPRFPWNRS